MADVLGYNHEFLNRNEALRTRYFSVEGKGELDGEYKCKQTFSIGEKSIREFYGDTAETFLKKLMEDLSKYDYHNEKYYIETMIDESSYEEVSMTVFAPIFGVEFVSETANDGLPFGFGINVEIVGNPQESANKMCENIVKVLKSEFTELVEEDIKLNLEIVDEADTNKELEADMVESLIDDWGDR